MEYVYGALLLHSAGQQVSEDGVTKVLKAAGVSVNESRVKALVASLEGVNIDEAVKQGAFAAAPAAAPAAAGAEKKEEKKEEEKKVSEEEAAAGLGALFG
ncbi:MAG: 50S ribosomal protein P1 [Methanobacteriota archaeon]